MRKGDKSKSLLIHVVIIIQIKKKSDSVGISFKSCTPLMFQFNVLYVGKPLHFWITPILYALVIANAHFQYLVIQMCEKLLQAFRNFENPFTCHLNLGWLLCA